MAALSNLIARFMMWKREYMKSVSVVEAKKKPVTDQEYADTTWHESNDWKGGK